jgi:hypothetical protein
MWHEERDAFALRRERREHAALQQEKDVTQANHYWVLLAVPARGVDVAVGIFPVDEGTTAGVPLAVASLGVLVATPMVLEVTADGGVWALGATAVVSKLLRSISNVRR